MHVLLRDCACRVARTGHRPACVRTGVVLHEAYFLEWMIPFPGSHLGLNYSILASSRDDDGGAGGGGGICSSSSRPAVVAAAGVPSFFGRAFCVDAGF